MPYTFHVYPQNSRSLVKKSKTIVSDANIKDGDLVVTRPDGTTITVSSVSFVDSEGELFDFESLSFDLSKPKSGVFSFVQGVGNSGPHNLPNINSRVGWMMSYQLVSDTDA